MRKGKGGGVSAARGVRAPARHRVATPCFHQPSEADQIQAGACANSSGDTFENECATRGNGSKQSSIWSAKQFENLSTSCVGVVGRTSDVLGEFVGVACLVGGVLLVGNLCDERVDVDATLVVNK